MKKFLRSLSKCVLVLSVSLGMIWPLVAQENEQLPGFSTQGSPTEMLITESLQRDVSAILFSYRGPSALSLGYPINSDPFWFVRLDPVAKELKMSENQLVTLAKLEESYGKKLNDTNVQLNQLFASERSGNTASRVEQLQNNIRSLIESRKTDIEKVLSEPQLQRLDQLALQIEFLVGRDANTLTSDRLAKELDIGTDQKAKLLQRAQEIDREFQTEFRALVATAQKKLHSELSPSQQKALNEKLGKPFDFEQLDWENKVQTGSNK